MKRRIPILAAISSLFLVGILIFNKTDANSVEKLRKKHQTFLDNSPFKETLKMSREERKAMALPPNAYNEQMFELTIDPNTGNVHPERVAEVQTQLRQERLDAAQQRGVGGDLVNPWIDRGPNNIGGRTRAIMFDPNDVGNANPADDYTRVFAGGVSGGIWVNEDITDANSPWTLILGAPANISVNVIIFDPNNLNTFYIGSGESYTNGQAVGRGIWKSEDAGVTWTNIFGGYTGISNGNQFVDGIFYVNDIIARDNGGTTEVYAAIAGAFYAPASSPNNWNGLNQMGLYKFVDDGVNDDTVDWNRFNITHGDGSFKNPNDLELDINNNIWMSITSNNFGNAGGDIYRSTDGSTFDLVGTIPGAARTEIEVSNINANSLKAAVNVPLANGQSQADLFDLSYNSGPNNITITQINTEPNDVDTGIPSTDYTRRQAFYDLPIEYDSNNNLYVGGIDLFRSINDGGSWTQISKWSNNNNLAAQQIPLVHADHHAIVFRPGVGNENKVVFGTDGGIYYSDDITQANNAIGNLNAITSRNIDYNVTQFYAGSIAASTANTIINGGTQDNGFLITQNAVPGANNFDNFYAFFAGDGANSEIDVVGGLPGRGEYHIVSSVFSNYLLADLPAVSPATGYIINQSNEGDFINEADLDDVGNIFYTDGTLRTQASTTFQIARYALGINSSVRTNLTNALLNSDPTALKVSPYVNTDLIVGLRNGGLLRLTNANAAEAWSNITGPAFVGSISDIEFGQNNQEIFVTMHNYGVTSVWFTNNGGAAWTNIEGNLPDIPVKCILQNPLIPEELIIGTELGVWATGDYTAAAPNWIQTDNGMSDVTVLDLDLRTADNTILAATHGRGMFTSQFTAEALSVGENTLANNAIKVFPTVNNGEFFISSNELSGKAKIELYTLTGQKVHASDFELTTNAKAFNMQLQSGIYLVNITVDNFRKTLKMVIK